ncbi:MAG: MotA/TolQ/ExbB proton channel family protein, partial [Alphaproteobacteria bacterium]|nr:MotA/TolQ/ExbB proton channel family protein [Alphaproteobacteria bacterium]
MNEVRESADYTSLFGILFASGLVLAAIFFGGSIKNFIDLESFLIVVGGTFFVTAACFRFEEVLHSFKVIGKTVFYESKDLSDVAYIAIKYAEKAYKKNIVTLSQSEYEIKEFSKFFWEGVQMVMDNATIEYVEYNMTQHIIFFVERHKKTVSMLKKAGEISPAMGLIGTLVGLVQMLSNLSDISKIGPAMAVALITTFYGACISYMFMFPLASKLERNTEEELVLSKILLETVM